jgi:uncharacterized protein (DUF1697 family)
MADLRALFTDVGCTEVQSYIQSGNIVFSSRLPVRDLEPKLVGGVAERFRCSVPIVFRTDGEWLKLKARNPLLGRGLPEDKLHVYFFRDAPGPERLAQIEPQRFAPDELIAFETELFLFTPNGLSQTKLTNAYLDAKLQTVSTARNWRTVEKIASLLASTVDPL